MTARRNSSSQYCRTTPGAALAAWIGALYSVPRLILPISLDSITSEIVRQNTCTGMTLYTGIDTGGLAAGNVTLCACYLTGVGCRALIQAASAAPGVGRQHRKDSTWMPRSCHLRGQLSRKCQTLSEATAHSRPHCVHLTSLT